MHSPPKKTTKPHPTHLDSMSSGILVADAGVVIDGERLAPLPGCRAEFTSHTHKADRWTAALPVAVERRATAEGGNRLLFEMIGEEEEGG